MKISLAANENRRHQQRVGKSKLTYYVIGDYWEELKILAMHDRDIGKHEVISITEQF